MPPQKTRSGRKRKLKDEEEEKEGASASTKRSKTEPTSKRTKSLKSSSKSSSKSTKSSESAEALKSAEASKSVAPSNSAGSEAGQRAFSHWLFKSEPDQTACWDGVRNYQARNFMKDHMRVGDKAFFYHSNAKPSGVIGLIHVVKESYVDHTQFDPKDPHYDPKSSKENPRWFMVDVKYDRPLKRFISLHELKALHEQHKKEGGPLKELALFTKARLSVQPLTQQEFDFIVDLENDEGKENGKP